MPKKVRVGFVGTGGIAAFQARILQKMEGVQVIAGADVSEKALSKFVDEFHIAHSFDDYNEMLQLKEIDAVSVCTPNYLHKDPAIAALKAGKHTLVEKPMAMNAREAQAMVDAARASKRKLVIGFQYRYSPPAQVIQRYVNEGNFGEVLFARVQALRRRGIPSWGVFGRKDLQGGGPLIDIGVHAIELAHYLMGSPRAVSASASMFTYLGDKAPTALPPWGDWDYKTYTVEDLAIGFVRFGNGACMIVESSFAAHIDQDIFNVTIMGEKGGASWSPLKIYKDEAGVMVNVEPTFVGKYDAFERKMQNWIAYVRGEGGTEAPGEAGVMVQKILDGLYRSSERAKEVSIK